MRRLSILLLFAFGVSPAAFSQACTGLCLQQVACAPGSTTSISGTVFAPNGLQPLPNVLVFVPNADIPAMTPGVTCPVPGTLPGGAPLVGTTTAADGTFRIDNVPVGNAIPLVIQSGRWRRVVKVPTVAQCTDNAFSIRMPRNQTEGDIPQFAVATGFADSVECVLRKVGIDDSEFTNPLSTGRIHLYGDLTYRSGNQTFGGGAVIDSNTPLRSTLTSDLTALKKYDVLMLPCEGSLPVTTSGELKNLIQYADAGGRVYASHYAYGWMYNNPPFDSVAKWHHYSTNTDAGTGTINPDFYGAGTLIPWLQTVGASSTPGQVDLFTIRHDLDGVNPPTQSWITLNDPSQGNPVMQLTFNTPVGNPNQCGRVLFNEYHVETRDINNTTQPNKPFPTECSTDPISPQEKLLEYSLFDLTNDGGQPTLTPMSAAFGDAYVGFTSAAKDFIWKNNSIFTVSVSTPVITGDFAITGNTCSSVVSGASCTIQVVFRPTATGPATGTLTVSSNSSKLVANLTGNGVTGLALSTSSLTFGNTDVGFPAMQSLTLRNVAPGAIALAGVLQAGDFTLASTCGTTLAAGASCIASVTFKPASTGTRTGQASFNGQAVTFNGNGVDFSTAFTPGSGSVIGGLPVRVPLAVLPLAGFSSPVQMTCSTTAPGSTCTLSAGSLVPSASAGANAQITTSAKYAVVGYGFSGTWQFTCFGICTGLLLWQVGRQHKRAYALLICLLGIGVCWLTGCGSKTPAVNPVYTTPGTYTYTVTATDGFLVHTATYSLAVTAK